MFWTNNGVQLWRVDVPPSQWPSICRLARSLLDDGGAWLAIAKSRPTFGLLTESHCPWLARDMTTHPIKKKTDKRLGSFSYYVNYIYFSMIITWFISTHGWVALHLWVGISVVSHSFYARAQCSSFGFINTITIIKFIFVKLLQVEIVQLCAGAFTLKTFEWIYTSCLVTLAAIQTVSKIPIIIFLCSRMWLLLINEWSLPATRCTYGNTKLFTVEMLNSETN